jgi:hypothetical protein
MFARKAEDDPTRYQHFEGGRGLQEIPHEQSSIQEMFEVIQDKQVLLVTKKAFHHICICVVGTFGYSSGQAKDLGNGGGNPGRIMNGSQRDKENAISKLHTHLARYL